MNMMTGSEVRGPGNGGRFIGFSERRNPSKGDALRCGLRRLELTGQGTGRISFKDLEIIKTHHKVEVLEKVL